MNKKFDLTLFVFLVFLVIPLILNAIGRQLATDSYLSLGDWLGFWGSYLGGFVTLAGVYLAFYLEHKKNIEERFLDRYLSVLKAEFLCTTIMNSEKEKILNSEWLDSKYSNLDEIALEISVISKEFNSMVRDLFTALLNVSRVQKKLESNEGVRKEAEDCVEVLQVKAREALELIKKIEGKKSA